MNHPNASRESEDHAVRKSAKVVLGPQIAVGEAEDLGAADQVMAVAAGDMVDDPGAEALVGYGVFRVFRLRT